jgi:hypothetical protein
MEQQVLKAVTEGDSAVLLLLIVYFLVEAVKFLLKNRDKKQILSKEVTALTSREHEMLVNLYEMHQKCDENGLPLWYVPRGYEKALDKIADAMVETKNLQERLVDSVSRIEKKLHSFNGPFRDVS